jgi:hypothetical protein
MREALLQRLERLEEARALRHRAATQIIHIHFGNEDSGVCRGARGIHLSSAPS